MLRDKLRDKNYFDEAITHCNKFVSEEVDYLSNTAALKPLAAMKTNAGLWSDLIDKLSYSYSRGDALVDLKQNLIDILKHREMQLHYAEILPKDETKSRVEWERLSFSNYKKIFTWLAFAVSTGANEGYFTKLFQLVDNSGLDILFDRIAVKLGDVERPIANALLYPKPYELLLKAIDAEPAQQAELMNKFMDAWYPACVKQGFYETHKITNNFGYAGYWCFEAALVVNVFNIDDRGFRDHRYYPADLVHARK